MGREPKTASERTQPLREAWEELHAAYRTVLLQVGFEAVSPGAEAVQAMTECTRRLREIAADFPDDDEDDDEAP